jgi:pimeloyl-ACP methyl ester carboxylesterase
LIRAARDLDPRETEHIGGLLRSSGIPALVLWGERDEFLSIDAVGRPLAELLGARLAKVPGAHFTPLDCPREVAAELQDFLGNNAGVRNIPPRNLQDFDVIRGTMLLETCDE